jgi:hypothetical protein
MIRLEKGSIVDRTGNLRNPPAAPAGEA